MQTQGSTRAASPLQRIIADNDVRNGSIADRLMRMSEHPERQPDADGLYRDEFSPPSESPRTSKETA